jgi:hypothetical protein
MRTGNSITVLPIDRRHRTASGGRGVVQYLFDDLAVMDLSTRYREAQRPAIAVGSR